MIAYAPNTIEPAAAAKLDNLYSTNFNAVSFPSSLMFDPFEEYRHVVFDRTVTIMGRVLLDDIDKINVTESNISTTSQQANESPRVQESQQLINNRGIQTQHQRSQIQQEDQWQEQLGMANHGSFAGPVYIVPQTAIPEANNQEKMISRSPWFPSVPSFFCDGEYSFVIEGTAKLDLDKLKKADQYDVKIKILTDKLGVSTIEDHGKVTGILGISDYEYLQDNGIGRDNDTSENTRVINSSDAIHDQDSNNLDIEKIQNSCRVHIYNTR